VRIPRGQQLAVVLGMFVRAPVVPFELQLEHGLRVVL
jgi:hypothetical protein